MGHLNQLSRSVVRITGGRGKGRLALPLVLALGAAAGGCGESSHQPGAPAGSAAQPQPGLASASPAQAAVAEPQRVIASGPLVSTFSGARNQAIGSLSEHRLLVIRWKVTKPPIQIYTAHGNLLLSSNRRSGAIRLGRGEYRKLHVATNGRWTIQLRAAD